MIQATYSELVKKISDASGLAETEIEKRVGEKKAKLSDLISKEGAAQIVAAELGVNFDRQKSKVSGLLVGMRRVSVVAKIMRMYPPREFTTKNNVPSKVMNMFIADDTAVTKCVIWDVNLIKLLEEGKIKINDMVEIKDATVRQGMNGKELHLGSTSGFAITAQTLPSIVPFGEGKGDFNSNSASASKKKISELLENERASVRAVIVQSFEPKFFMVCPECGKKPLTENGQSICQTHGPVTPKERSLMNWVLDDGSGNIRAVGFNDVITKVFGINETEIRNISERRTELIGKEMIFTGKARKNKMFDNIEFLINDIEQVDPEKLLGELGAGTNPPSA